MSDSPSQQQIVRGPHKWDAEKKAYIPTGQLAPAAAPVGLSAQLAAILRGPHKFVAGENGEAGRYVVVAAPVPAPRHPPASAAHAPGPKPGQPIYRRAQ